MAEVTGTGGGPQLVWDRSTKFKFERFFDIKPRKAAMRIKGLLPSYGVCFIAGLSKGGKTFFSLDLGLRLASGAATIFKKKAKGCAVAYFGAEDPDGCRTRVAAWRKKYPRQTPLPFEFVGAAPNLLDEGDVEDLKESIRQHALLLAEEGHELGVVFLDTMSACIPGADENNSMDMSRVLAVAQGLAKDLGVLVVVVAHFGKGGSDKGIRGWSGLGANADAVILVERDTEDTDLRKITFDKVKNGRDGFKINFRLEEVDTGEVDEDGDAIVSCVPIYESVTSSSLRPKATKPLSPPQQAVLLAAKHVTDHGETFALPPSTEGLKPWQKGVTVTAVRDRAFAAGFSGEGENRNARNVRFNRSLEAVIGRGLLRQEGTIVWLV